jgi:hypothetical protein
MAGLVASREVLDVATSESNEHVAEAVPLGTSDPPLRVSAVLRRPLFTAPEDMMKSHRVEGKDREGNISKISC